MNASWISLALIYFMGMLEKANLQLSVEQTVKNFYINLYNKYGTQHNTTQEGQMLNEIVSFDVHIRENVSRKKRENSFLTDDIDVHLLQDNGNELNRFTTFVEAGRIPVPHAKSITLFSHYNVDKSTIWHAITLQDNYETMGDFLKLYKYNQNQESWILLWTEKILKSSKVYSISEPKGTLLVITHSCMSSSSSSDGATVFYLDDNSRLQKIQSLKICPYSDVLLWRADYIFLAFARDYTEIKETVLFETDSTIYVWKGKHFNFLQNILTSNAKKISAIQMGSCHYFAVANHQNNYGEKKIFSEIFKYDAHEGKYLPYQKLPTDAAMDLTFFSFIDGSYEENYLLIANVYIMNYRNDIGSHVVVYKFENDVFVPFQSLYVIGLTQWISVVGLPGEFFILAISETSGLTVFQHNGWHFVEIPYKCDAWFQNPTRKTIKSYNFYGKPLLVISDSYNDGSYSNLYYALFERINPAKEMNKQLLTWCSKLQTLSSCADQCEHGQYKKIEELLKILKNYHVLESNQLQVNKTVFLNLALIGKIKTNAIYANDIHLNATVIHNINKLYKMFDLQLSSLKSLEDIFPNAMCDDGNIYMESLNIKNLELDCESQPCVLNDIEILKLNHKDLAEYQKEIFYSEYIYDFYDEVNFESLTVEENFDVEKINGKSIQNVDLFIQELAKVAGVIVEGDVYLYSSVSVAGLLDGIKISEEFILLTDSDQSFVGTFSIPRIQTELLEANQINDLTSKAIRDIIVNENKTTASPYYMSKLTVEEAFIEGVVNKIKIDSINSNALKVSGDQDIDGVFDISVMKTPDVLVSSSPDQVLMESFISIKGGSFDLNQEIHFNTFNTPNINITKRLNDIHVTDGELALLLLDSPKMQRVTGDKMFQNVELMGPIVLQGQINSRSLERKNPMTMIEEPLILTGNFIIQGNVSIERALNCENLFNRDNSQSVKHLQQRGLKLTEDRILTPLFFSQPLEVRNIDCDSINGINPLSWISSQGDSMKTVSGKKTFLGGLNIQGSCAIMETLNEVNPTFLDKDTLKISGDQEITGKIFFANLTTKGLNCKNISFGEQPFENLLTISKDFVITAEVNIVGGATVHGALSADQIDITGLTAGYSINSLFEDTVMMSSEMSEINGNIVFHEPLIIENLDLYEISGVNLQKLLSSENWNKEILFDEPLYINKNIVISNIIFDLSIAGISKSDFGNSWLLTDGSQTFHGRQYFAEINCDGGIYLETGKINNHELSFTYSNIIWLDQNMIFSKADFKNGLCVYNSLRVGGFVSNLVIPQDLIVKRKYTGDEQMIFGETIIKKNLHISGLLETDYISNVNLPYFCQITLSNEDFPCNGLYIDGSLKFYKEPDINKLNNINILELMSNVWLSDEPSILYGNIFIAKVTLENMTAIQGHIGGIDLHRLSEKFISLTDDEDIMNSLEISHIQSDKIKVKKDTIVGNYVHGLAFNTFYNDTMKIGSHQTIDKQIDFDTVFVKENFQLDGKINNLNLDSDVFRLDSKNHNTNHITLNAAKINSLSILKGNLQNIDIGHYFKNVMDKTAMRFSDVRGTKTIQQCTATAGDITVSGLINGKKIVEENILLKNIPQIVTGRKIITPKDVSYFRFAKISKNINNYNADDTFKSLIKTNDKEVIVRSPKIIESRINSDNLFVDGKVNGLNFSSLTNALKSPKQFKSYNKEYTELVNYSHQISSNFERPSRKLIDMKTTHIITPGEILSVTSIPQTLETMKAQLAVAFKNSVGLFEIRFYSWNRHQHIFEQSFEMKSLIYNVYVTKLFCFTLGTQTILFVEIYDANSHYKILLLPFDERFGQFDQNSNNQLESNVTTTAVSLESTDQNCIFVASMFGASQLYCHEKHTSVDRLRWCQSIVVYNTTEVAVLNISGTVHILVASINTVQVLRWVGTGRGTLATLQSLPGVTSFSATSFGRHHLAAALHNDFITIYKFNSDMQRFESQQNINILGAKKLQFVTLPGEQLVLIIFDAQFRLTVYANAGIAGFHLELTHYTSVPHVNNLMSITTRYGQHFTALVSHNQIQIVETILK